ncbi:hypothetical protein P3T18_001208 [Paraburkholderia sp. GAS199]
MRSRWPSRLKFDGWRPASVRLPARISHSTRSSFGHSRGCFALTADPHRPPAFDSNFVQPTHLPKEAQEGIEAAAFLTVRVETRHNPVFPDRRLILSRERNDEDMPGLPVLPQCCATEKPSMRGMLMSRSAISGGQAITAVATSSPLSTYCTLYPDSERNNEMASTPSRKSSTTSSRGRRIPTRSISR